MDLNNQTNHRYLIHFRKYTRVGLVLLMLVMVSLLHFLTGTLDHDLHAWHLFFRKLFFIPIIAAAVWFGLSGALLTALGAIFIFSLHVWLDWLPIPMERMDQLGEMVSFLVLAAAAGVLASLEQRTRERAQKNKVRAVVAALSETLAARDPATRDHCQRVARQAEGFAAYLGLPDEERRDIFLAGVLHDIGKVGIPDDILLKPDSLTEEERRKIMEHPGIAEHILAAVGFDNVVSYVATHHENIDSSGYPLGLTGQEIPLGGKVLALVDTYDALLSKRPYHQALNSDGEIKKIMDTLAGHKLDQELLDKFWAWKASSQGRAA